MGLSFPMEVCLHYINNNYHVESLICTNRCCVVKGVHLEGEQITGDLSDGRQGEMLIRELHLGESSGLVLASAGASQTSKSSLGLLGCLIFGLLFWREKQANIANITSLEDVHVRIKNADAELSSWTRYSVGFKLEEAHLNFENEMDSSRHGALKHQLFSVKSSNVEKGMRLEKDIYVSNTLKQQIRKLTVSIDEIKNDCTSLRENTAQKTRLREVFEEELQNAEAALQLKAEEISSLKLAIEELEQAYKKLIGKSASVESSLDMLDKKVSTLKVEIEGLKSSLNFSCMAAGHLLEELNIVASSNESLETKIAELRSNLEHEKAALTKLKADKHELLVLNQQKAQMLSNELTRLRSELDGDFEIARQLAVEKAEVEKVLREKNEIVESSREALSADVQRLRVLESEMHTLCQQLHNEESQTLDLKTAQKNNAALKEIIDILQDLESQISIEKEVSNRFEKDLHDTLRALTLSETEVLGLEKNLDSIKNSIVHLQDELVRVNELGKSLKEALKKEKRATAYARRQHALKQNKLTNENLVVEELQNELQKFKDLILTSRAQVHLKNSQLKEAGGIAKCLTDDVSALAATHEEQTRLLELKDLTQQIQLTSCDKVSPIVPKASHRQDISDIGVEKSRRKLE
ncbi:hypothetical protein KP509_37G054200 [Ceratopteris richardii]|uniref:Uncharacterized protein n=1 Tax=Ceratopteris richardii TaxID=49495 RepID=A0A8T2Q961_CERRI|nr:hypothetical protein KP509_37G054200 [Ceratopteris richardii]